MEFERHPGVGSPCLREDGLTGRTHSLSTSTKGVAGRRNNPSGRANALAERTNGVSGRGAGLSVRLNARSRRRLALSGRGAGCRRPSQGRERGGVPAQPARTRIEERRAVVSEAHPGLRDAIASVLSGAAWQRCRTHFIRNLLTKVPKSAHGIVATFVRMIRAARRRVRANAARAHRRAASAALRRHREDARANRRSCSRSPRFPKSTGDRLEQQPARAAEPGIRRRTDVVGIFPNRERIVRLVGAVLCELNNDWAIVRRYMTIEMRGGKPSTPRRSRRRAQRNQSTDDALATPP